ncbi:C40 family peptidase [Candidatus Uhrbacteria bacterium]|nr:MAG: C40 family peptidase [Candidatus Uhrbacteria bacterium]
MHFQAVGTRCAAHLPSLELPIGDREALEILERLGYRRVSVDIVALARAQVGVGVYRRGARMREVPSTFDCSSFTKWLYGQRGVRLPRKSIQQYEACSFLSSGRFLAGDLAFSTGAFSWYRHNPALGIGHVGLVTDEQTVIHAANPDLGVVEERLEVWQGWQGFRGVRRFIPSDVELVTLECPPDAEIEWSDDIRWKILQRLPR